MTGDVILDNRLTIDEVHRLARQAAALLSLVDGGTKDHPWQCGCGCRNRALHTLRVAEQSYTVFRSTSGGRSAKGDHADPVFATATGEQVDPSPQWLPGLTDAARAASKAIQDLAGYLHTVGRIESSDPHILAQAGQGDCVVCDTYCSGAVNDRLRAGYCDACRKAWKRAGSPDRAEFKRARRAQLALEEKGQAS